jgi:hypothetical protein
VGRRLGRDIATYLASALLISLISAPTAATDDEPDVASGVAVSAWANALKEWLEGLRLIGRNRSVAVLFAVVLIAHLGEGAVTVLIIIVLGTRWEAGRQSSATS